MWRVGSTCLTVSVTLERYIAVCHPLHCDMMLQSYLLAASAIFAFGYNIPKFFEFKAITVDDTILFRCA